MKTRLLFPLMVLAFLFVSSWIQAQYYVPTEPMNKNAIIEEFTGVQCPNCPAGHQVVAQILAANPDRAFCVAYHPFNSNYTTPYSGDPDFRRHYADAFYTTPYCGTSRYMPSAFINRRLWEPPERLTQRTTWTARCNTIMAESSPLNVGMATSYDQGTQDLTVVVDVYYTDNVTGDHNLMVTLAENNLVSQQSGAGANYVHKHTFREAFVDQWGDPLSTNAQQGTYYRNTFVFNNATMGYDMSNCELLAFVVDNTNEEVISGIGCAVGDTTYNPISLTLSCDSLIFTTVQQCLDGLTATIYNNSGVGINILEVNEYGDFWYVLPWPFTSFPHLLASGDSIPLTVYVNIPIDATTDFLYDTLNIISETGNQHVIIAIDESLITGIGKKIAAASAKGPVPNPFTTETMIKIELPAPGDVRLDILNTQGQCVAHVNPGYLSAGIHTISWDGVDLLGVQVPAGVYFFKLITGSETSVVRGVKIH